MNFRGSLRDSMHGFTLVELMVVITVMAVLASIAIPSVTQLLANRRMKSAAFELQSSVVQARSLAASANLPAGMMPAYPGGWSVPSATRSSGTIQLPNAGDASKTALQNAQLSWYVVTSGPATPTSMGLVSMANSTANAYPVQVSLPDQTLITVTTTPSTVAPSASSGICFSPSGYIGTTVSGATSCVSPSANAFSRVSFRVCDSASTLHGATAGYTVIVGAFGTVQTYTGDPVGGTSC